MSSIPQRLGRLTMSDFDRNSSNLTNLRGVEGTPNEAALLKLMERTGYSMIQENGQRKYGGPPPDWGEKPTPIKGCEIFVGKIPRDIFEDELVPIFERCGRIYEMRLMMDFSGSNRGYAFVMYTNRGDALRAVKEMNNYRIREERYLGVCMSVDNCRLFVGGIPKQVCKEEILHEMQKVTDGVVDVIVYPSAADKTKNRGFAFVEYSSHRAAAMARRKLIPGKIPLFNHPIAVDWAEPEREVEDDVMEKVRILYMRNLMLTTTEDTIEKTCNLILGVPNGVERVKKIRDYAFVHFRSRDDALKVRDKLNGLTTVDGAFIEAMLAKPIERHDSLKNLCFDDDLYNQNPVMDNTSIEITLAKPVDRSEYHRFSRNMGAPRSVFPQHFAHFGAGGMPGYLGGAPAGALFNPFAAMPPRPAPAGMQEQQPNFNRGMPTVGHGGSPPRGRGTSGRGAGGSRLNMGRGIYNATMKKKHPGDILEEYCSKNGWGLPVYQLHSTVSQMNGEQLQLFLYKVTIPALVNSQNPAPFTPSKLCRSTDEAKFLAAEYVLQQMGIPSEDSLSQYSSASSGDLQQQAQLPPTTYLPPSISDFPIYPAFPQMADLALALPMHWAAGGDLGFNHALSGQPARATVNPYGAPVYPIAPQPPENFTYHQ